MNDPELVEKKYRELAKVGLTEKIVKFHREENDYVVGRVNDRGFYIGPWFRFLADGKIEMGILWGGNIWEGSLLEDETWK